MKTELSERNRDRPATIDDFDLHLALHNLKNHSDSPRQRQWVTPLWQNYLFLAFTIIGLWSIYVACYQSEFELMPGPPWSYLLWGFLILVGASIMRVLLGGALHRGRLVLDRERRELRFYRSLIWPRAVACLALDDIAALVARRLDAADADPDSSGWTYKIVAAELHDGRLASIAVDSAASIISALRAVDSARHSSIIAGKPALELTHDRQTPQRRRQPTDR
jgi:hypothetical protein